MICLGPKQDQMIAQLYVGFLFTYYPRCFRINGYISSPKLSLVVGPESKVSNEQKAGSLRGSGNQTIGFLTRVN